MATITYAQAFIDGIYEAMAAEPRMTVIGRSILGHGGARGLDRKLKEDFASRIIDPPTLRSIAVMCGEIRPRLQSYEFVVPRSKCRSQLPCSAADFHDPSVRLQPSESYNVLWQLFRIPGPKAIVGVCD